MHSRVHDLFQHFVLRDCTSTNRCISHFHLPWVWWCLHLGVQVTNLQRICAVCHRWFCFEQELAPKIQQHCSVHCPLCALHVEWLSLFHRRSSPHHSLQKSFESIQRVALPTVQQNDQVWSQCLGVLRPQPGFAVALSAHALVVLRVRSLDFVRLLSLLLAFQVVLQHGVQLLVSILFDHSILDCFRNVFAAPSETARDPRILLPFDEWLLQTILHVVQHQPGSWLQHLVDYVWRLHSRNMQLPQLLFLDALALLALWHTFRVSDHMWRVRLFHGWCFRLLSFHLPRFLSCSHNFERVSISFTCHLHLLTTFRLCEKNVYPCVLSCIPLKRHRLASRAIGAFNCTLILSMKPLTWSSSIAPRSCPRAPRSVIFGVSSAGSPPLFPHALRHHMCVCSYVEQPGSHNYLLNYRLTSIMFWTVYCCSWFTRIFSLWYRELVSAINSSPIFQIFRTPRFHP